MSDLASVLRLNGDLAGAETLLRQSFDDQRQDARRRSSRTPRRALHDLALIAASARRLRRGGVRLLRQALAMQRKALGDRHPVVAATLNSLSRVLLEQRPLRRGGRHGAARPRTIAARRSAPIISSSRSTRSISQRCRRRRRPAPTLPSRCCARACAFAPARRASCRRGAAPVREDDWSVGAAKSLLGAVLHDAPPIPGSGGRRCSTRAASSSRCRRWAAPR